VNAPSIIPARVRPWFDAALGFVYPEVCQLCQKHRATPPEGYVCAECWKEVRFIVPPFCERCGLPFHGEIDDAFECSNCREMELHFAAARSAVAARGPVLEAVHRYKYGGQLWFEEFLISLLVPSAREWFGREKCTALVPVPLFPVKERERGFNQAERLAQRLGAAMTVPVERKLLKRVAPTPTQTRLSRKERAENMRNAFVLRRDEPLTGGHFVLIDDVFTTGATTSACAKLLLRAGAERVTVWTVARAEFHT
jgi:competence protein ComFC